MNTLTTTVGESPKLVLARTDNTMQAIQDGVAPTAYFGVGFENMAQLGEVFTPKRWELTEWMVIEKNAEGLVFVPWDEIDVRWPLAMAMAA